MQDFSQITNYIKSLYPEMDPDGSLLYGFNRRLDKGLPLSAQMIYAIIL